jgi:hypothetical protein
MTRIASELPPNLSDEGLGIHGPWSPQADDADNVCLGHGCHHHLPQRQQPKVIGDERVRTLADGSGRAEAIDMGRVVGAERQQVDLPSPSRMTE